MEERKNANTLYKDKENHTYILALAPGSSSDHEFNKICNMPEKRLLTQAIRSGKKEKGDSENENVDGN